MRKKRSYNSAFSRRSLKGWLLRASLVLFPVIFASPAGAAIPPAGITIIGRSTATYELAGNLVTAQSNEVIIGILPVYGPVLLPDGTAMVPAAERAAFSEETVTFPFTLANAGNADDNFELIISVVNPSGFVPEGAAVYLDIDADGFVDPGENIVTTVGPLVPGASVSLVLSVSLPEGLAGGETAHLDLQARSLAVPSLADEGNIVRITARDEARVSLRIESDRSGVLPGGTVVYTVRFANLGERAATDVVVTDFIDYAGMSEGTVYVDGSLYSSLPGRFEYFDLASFEWVEVAPPEERVKGARLRLETLAAGADGFISFEVRVAEDHSWGSIFNAASAGYTGGDARLYSLSSSEISVLVARVSELSIGPPGNPGAPEGGIEDRNITVLGNGDSSCIFRHELLSSGNFTDTVRVALADSTLIPGDWSVEFVDGEGSPLPAASRFTAVMGAVESGESRIVGLRLGSTAERLRQFPGREMEFAVEARSIVEPLSSNGVTDVMVKSDIPLLSVKQSIREPNAMIGDILSFIVTIENMTEETTVDSIVLVETLSAGLGFAGGSDKPAIEGNSLTWTIGTVGPGEKREVVFRAGVKAGQERDELISVAWVYGVSSLGERTSDGPSAASIRIVEGVFTRKGLVFGGVFIDENKDGVRGGDESGVRGVSVFLENGTCAVTDSAGLYSIPGVPEGRHVVRMDPKTLPDSLCEGEAGYFGLGVGGEFLVDLAPSGNRRVDFSLRRQAGYMQGDTSAAFGDSDPAVASPAAEPEDSRRGFEPAVSEAAREESVSAFAGRGRSGQPGTAGYPENPAEDAFREQPAAGNPDEAMEGYEALIFPGGYFEPAGAIMEEIPIREVASLNLWMMEHPGWTIMISGHTDSIPISTAEYPSNFELSLERARSVFQVLRMNGIPESRMDYTGYGSRRPRTTDATEEGRSLNRRVEIRVMPPADYAGADPDLPSLFARPDTTQKEFSLADDAGVCAGIIKPDEGHIFTMRDKIDVEVLAPLTSGVELYVNNVPVGREKIGQKQIDVGNGTIGFIFYDVKIAEGRNDILVVCRNHGVNDLCVRHVYLAGRPAGIAAERETISVPADGRTSPEIVFLVNDKAGLPVRDGIFVTVTGPGDLLDGVDINPHQAGVQAGTLNGRVVLNLSPSADPRREKINVLLDGLTGGCRVAYESPMRDWFLFGYGETDAGVSSLTGNGSTDRSAERHHDGLYAEGKFALYGQGEIRDGHLMTLAIDSRPVREDRLLGRIEPEMQYPVYGDASELRFNSASRSGTYVRLDHKRYNAMFGDFETALGGLEFTRYTRTFNGLSGEARFSGGGLKSFITRTDQVTWQEEMPADGTSGFYFLAHYPLIENSEKINVEVRDRYRPENVIRVDEKKVNRDYDINYMDGSILFKEPLAAFDENLNPVVIIASYECRGEEEINFTYGLRGSVDISDSLKAGATAIVEEEGGANSSIVGIDVSGPVYRGVSIESEFARSDKFLLGAGNAFRIKLAGVHPGRVRWNTYYRDIDGGFFNPSFTGGKTELGSRKIGADLDWRLTGGYSVAAGMFRHDFRQLGEKKRYFDLCGLYRSGPLSVKAGLAAASRGDDLEGSRSSTLMLGSAAWEQGSTRGELEVDQKIAGEEVEEYPNRVQASLSRKLWKHVSGSLKHEYRTGRRSGARHLTQAGIESRINEDLDLYSRYRMEGAVSGERGQAIVGLKNRFRLSDALTSTFSAERLATVSGAGNDDYTAFATAWLYTPEKDIYKIKGDYEVRIEPERLKHLVGLAGLRKLGTRWAGLLKGDLWYSDEEIEADRVKGDATLGASCRPMESGPLTVFSLVKTRYEKNSPAHPGAVDKDLVIMTEANWTLDSRWEVEGKVAGRWVKNTFKSYTASTASFLYQAQAIRKFAGCWDVTFAARLVHQRETGTLRSGGGLQLGRVVARNVWIGCGYDFGGHRDADAPVNDFNRNGFHVGMKVKFNEKILEYFHNGGD